MTEHPARGATGGSPARWKLGMTKARLFRDGLAVLAIVAAPILVIFRPDIIGLEGAALLLGSGLGIILSNRLLRMGMRNNVERSVEQDARGFMERYGVWPDDASEELLTRAEREGHWVRD